jgi:hypothetical protein
VQGQGLGLARHEWTLFQAQKGHRSGSTFMLTVIMFSLTMLGLLPSSDVDLIPEA